MSDEPTFDHENTYEIVCPHCGHNYHDSLEWGAGKDSGHDICDNCGCAFNWEREISVSYTTKPI